MTRRDILQTAHEPFGDAFYYGPERLSKRFENDEDARVKSGFAESTYRTVMDRLDNDGQQEVRWPLFVPHLHFNLLSRKIEHRSIRLQQLSCCDNDAIALSAAFCTGSAKDFSLRYESSSPSIQGP